VFELLFIKFLLKQDNYRRLRNQFPQSPRTHTNK